MTEQIQDGLDDLGWPEEVCALLRLLEQVFIRCCVAKPDVELAARVGQPLHQLGSRVLRGDLLEPSSGTCRAAQRRGNPVDVKDLFAARQTPHGFPLVVVDEFLMNDLVADELARVELLSHSLEVILFEADGPHLALVQGAVLGELHGGADGDVGLVQPLQQVLAYRRGRVQQRRAAGRRRLALLLFVEDDDQLGPNTAFKSPNTALQVCRPLVVADVLLPPAAPGYGRADLPEDTDNHDDHGACSHRAARQPLQELRFWTPDPFWPWHSGEELGHPNGGDGLMQ
mmetsp:Transcript_26397/g.82275  ORF Transcript_26397/g.82275 Transcript_26397/m.82275 type:complete len:285 (-) Transcript_26397:6-860(-)